MKRKQVQRKFLQPDRPDQHSSGFPSLFPKTNRLCLPRHTGQPGTSFRGETSDGCQSQILLFKFIRTTRIMLIDTNSALYFFRRRKKKCFGFQKSHPHKPESSACSVLCCAAVRMTPLGPLGQSGCAGYPNSPIGPGTAQLPNHGPTLPVS